MSAQNLTPIFIEELHAAASEKSISWSLAKMRVPEAQALIAQSPAPNGTKPVIVAVIDTGIDLEHPDLENSIYHNPFETRSRTGAGKDDDLNGFIDDFFGWNFESESNEVEDDFGHGTHVAGIIHSICPNAKMISIKWMKDGSGWGADAIEGIRYAVKMGARVINASWGGIGFTKDLESAVKEAEAQGVLFVASAGNKSDDNDSTPRHPANLKLSNMISVANSNEQDRLDSTSNFGSKSVHIAAPGMNIVSTTMDHHYGKMSGTSMAAAAVSGVAALMISLNPAINANTLKEVLMSTADRVPELSGRIISGARINAYQAALSIKP